MAAYPPRRRLAPPSDPAAAGRWHRRKAGGEAPRLTEAQRDGELATQLGGTIPDRFRIYNTTAGRYEFYDADAADWKDADGELEA